MSDLLLREATAADLPATLAVLHAAFEEYRAWMQPPSGVHRETVASLQAHLEQGPITLALLGDALVGAVLYQISGDHVYFGRLSVLPAYRSRGIARALIAHVEAFAREHGLARTQLSVRVSQPDNRAYYERLGYVFVESRCHSGYSEPTYVVMEKTLG